MTIHVLATVDSNDVRTSVHANHRQILEALRERLPIHTLGAGLEDVLAEIRGMGIAVEVTDHQAPPELRLSVDPAQPGTPTLVFARDGIVGDDGGTLVEVVGYYAGGTQRPALRIDTEDHAGGVVMLNDGEVFSFTGGGDTIRLAAHAAEEFTFTALPQVTVVIAEDDDTTWAEILDLQSQQPGADSVDLAGTLPSGQNVNVVLRLPRHGDVFPVSVGEPNIDHVVLDARKDPVALPPLARQLIAWADDSVSCVAFLEDGTTVTSMTWADGNDGTLMWEGDGGVLHFLDPARIVYIRYTDHEGARESVRRR